MYTSITPSRSASNPTALALLSDAGGADLPAPLRDAVAAALRRPEQQPDAGQCRCVYAPDGRRVYLLGGGPVPTDPSDTTATPARHAHVLSASASLLGQLHAAGVTRVQLHDSLTRDPALAQAVGLGVSMANERFEAHHGPVKAKASRGPRPTRLALLVTPKGLPALSRGLALGRSVNLARQLAATPPNVINPATLAARCRALARSVGLRCRVIDAAQAKRMGMGGLLAVGAAGSTPPCLIVLEWRPPRATGKPTLLVGKAITFDTGGYSIKPAASMLGMKYDKAGGCAVIGTMHAAATLGLPHPLVGIIAAAENMVSADAYRPNDILTMHNGVTVEVTNTDAEGRLVLADALAYGCETFQPREVIDLATLTGGVVVALGRYCAGAFVRDEGQWRGLERAGERCGERIWRLPLWEEHRAMMAGSHSDLVNSGKERGASPIQGAIFLDHFVPEGLPWAHLDIAGVSDTEKDTPLLATGPTGFGVRLLTEYLHAAPGERRGYTR